MPHLLVDRRSLLSRRNPLLSPVDEDGGRLFGGQEAPFLGIPQIPFFSLLGLGAPFGGAGRVIRQVPTARQALEDLLSRGLLTTPPRRPEGLVGAELRAGTERQPGRPTGPNLPGGQFGDLGDRLLFELLARALTSGPGPASDAVGGLAPRTLRALPGIDRRAVSTLSTAPGAGLAPPPTLAQAAPAPPSLPGAPRATPAAAQVLPAPVQPEAEPRLLSPLARALLAVRRA